jgi:5'-nucleotidase
MADVVADARLAATQAPPMRADFAIINGGGVRAPLPFTYPGQSTAPGDVTFGAAHNVLPFNDVLLTETLTGAQVLELLNENWNSSKEMFGVSHNVAFTWDASLPGTAKVVPGSVKINGKPLDPAARYRITIDGFLASGGDNYTVLKQGTDPVTGPIDIQSLTDYLATHNPLAPPPRDRVTRLH